MPNDLNWLTRRTDSSNEPSIIELREQALKKQTAIYQKFRRGRESILPENFLTLTSKEQKDLIAKTKELVDGEALTAFLKDYRTMMALKSKLIQIPLGDGVYQPYCVIDEDVGGVTEKVSLCRHSDVTTAFTHLMTADTDELAQNYLSHRTEVSFHVNAMIKRPKHGEVCEVQREAVALGISRKFGLATTDSLMVNHDNVPGLFVPFGQITELNEVAKGVEKTAVSFSLKRKSYQDNATISAVGEGTYGDVMVKGIGHAFALFYLCNDPDAIGGYLQNKATSMVDGEELLYIFDQVLKDEDRKIFSDVLFLDRSLNVSPSFRSSVSRHTCGRNRSIMNDADFEEKYQSIVSALQRGREMIASLTESRQVYLRQMDGLDRGSQAYKTLDTLQEDLGAAISTLSRRLATLQSVMDSYPKVEGEPLLTQKLALFERFINQPTLYTEDGRAYQHMHSHKLDVTISAVKAFKSGDFYELKLEGIKEKGMESVIRRIQATTGEKIVPGNPIIISKKTLEALNEFSIFPEASDTILPNYDYLHPDDVAELSSTSRYSARPHPHTKDVVKYLTDYRKILKSAESSPDNFVSVARKVRDRYNRTLMEEPGNLGFIAHAKRLYQYATQQKILSLIEGQELRDKVQQAFVCAKALDRVDDFQDVLFQAIEEGALLSEDINLYLDEVISTPPPSSHAEAVVASQQFSARSQEVSLLLRVSGIPEGLKMKIAHAVHRATELGVFNCCREVIESAIRLNQLNSPQFEGYLDYLLSKDKPRSKAEGNALKTSILSSSTTVRGLLERLAETTMEWVGTHAAISRELSKGDRSSEAGVHTTHHLEGCNPLADMNESSADLRRAIEADAPDSRATLDDIEDEVSKSRGHGPEVSVH